MTARKQIIQGRRNRGARGAMAPTFLQTMQTCPFEARNGRGNVPLLGLGPSHFLDASYVPEIISSSDFRSSSSILGLHVFFYKHSVYKHIQAQIGHFFKHMLSIFPSLDIYSFVVSFLVLSFLKQTKH